PADERAGRRGAGEDRLHACRRPLAARPGAPPLALPDHGRASGPPRDTLVRLVLSPPSVERAAAWPVAAAARRRGRANDRGAPALRATPPSAGPARACSFGGTPHLRGARGPRTGRRSGAPAVAPGPYAATPASRCSASRAMAA